MMLHTKSFLSLLVLMMLTALPAALAQTEEDYAASLGGGISSPQFRMLAISAVAKLQDPSLSIDADTPHSNATALKAALSANIGALGDKCDTGKIPAADCTTYLNEMNGFLADNKISASEVKPWLDKVDVLAK